MSYIKSKNINVYPSAYRGKSGSSVYDPESRLFTEENMTRILQALSTYKDGSFVITPNAATALDSNDRIKNLEFVIGGYYFRILDATLASGDYKDIQIPASGEVWAHIAVSYKGVAPGSGSGQDPENLKYHIKSLCNLNTGNILDNSTTPKNFEGVELIINPSSHQNGWDSEHTERYNYWLLLFKNKAIPETSYLKFKSGEIDIGDNQPLDKHFNINYDTPNSKRHLHIGNDSRDDTIKLKTKTNRIEVLEDYVLIYPENDKTHTYYFKLGKVGNNEENLLLQSYANNITLQAWNGDDADTSITLDSRRLDINGTVYQKKGTTQVERFLPYYWEVSDSSASDFKGSECYSVDAPGGEYSMQIGELGFTIDQSIPGDRDHNDYILWVDSTKTRLKSGYLTVDNTTEASKTTSGSATTYAGSIIDNGGLLVKKNIYVAGEGLSSGKYSVYSEGSIKAKLDLEAERNLIVYGGGNIYGDERLYGNLRLQGYDSTTQTDKDIGGKINFGSGDTVFIGEGVLKIDGTFEAQDDKLSLKANNYVCIGDGLKIYNDTNERPLQIVIPVNIDGAVSEQEVFSVSSGGTTYAQNIVISSSNGVDSTPPALSIAGGTQLGRKSDESSKIVLRTGYSPAGGSYSTRMTLTNDGILSLLVNESAPATNSTNGALTTAGGIYAAKNIRSGSQIIAQTFNSLSDRRLKENIKPFESKRSILELPVVEFDFKDTKKHSIGCIAQDLQEICPELVYGDDILSIEEGKLVYLLINEVKKLKAEVDDLKSKI